MNRRSLFGRLIGAVVGIKAAPVIAYAPLKKFNVDARIASMESFSIFNRESKDDKWVQVCPNDDHAIHIAEHMKHLRGLHKNGEASPLRLEEFLNHVHHHCAHLSSGDPLMSNDDRKLYMECCEIVINHKRKLS